MARNDFVKLSGDEVEEMDRALRFALGVLELFHGVGNDVVKNTAPVLLAAENKIYAIVEILEEKYRNE